MEQLRILKRFSEAFGPSTAEDGVIEAIESEMMDWFAIGTQFHPECAAASALDVRIFEEFIEGICAAKV